MNKDAYGSVFCVYAEVIALSGDVLFVLSVAFVQGDFPSVQSHGFVGHVGAFVSASYVGGDGAGILAHRSGLGHDGGYDARG